MTSRVACMVGLLGFVAVACTYQLPKTDPLLVCGDGFEDPEEECDDGNKDDDDGCDSNCTETRCGNGIITYGEECDDGNTLDEDACTNACLNARCGDGFVQAPEECDDKNTTDGDGCDMGCILSRCGNGIIGINEVCDDKNALNGDTCNTTCTLKNKTSIYLGALMQPSDADGQGIEARVSDQPILTIYGTTMYFTGTNVIRSVDLNTGQVVTIAGSGALGHDDNPTGKSATFGDIEGIATDGITLWVSDSDNHLLRAVNLLDPARAVTTVAGTFADPMATVKAMDGNGPSALFDRNRGMVFYNGLVYLLDSGANTLRTFNPMNKEVKTIAGTPYQAGNDDGVGAAARFMGPRQITSDGRGMLYITDTDGHTVRSFNTLDNEVKTIAGSMTCGHQDGVKNDARTYRPRGITTDGSSVYFTELLSHTIRQIVIETGEVSTLSGVPPKCAMDCTCAAGDPGGFADGVGTQAMWNLPWGIAHDPISKNLFVSDAGNSLIRRIQ